MPLEFSSCLLLPTIGALLLSFEGEVRSIVRVPGLQGSRGHVVLRARVYSQLLACGRCLSNVFLGGYGGREVGI